MVTLWLAKRWEALFLVLENGTEAEIEAACQAEIEAWRARPGMKVASSLRVPMTDTRNEIKRRVQGERQEWALRSMDFSEAEWRAMNAKSQGALGPRLENAALLTQPDEIVQKATALLASNDWAEVAIGVTVNTGRRLTEVLKTAEFGPKSEYSVMFSGQLKRRDRGNVEEPVSFEIPTLAPATLVLNALVCLRDMVGTVEMDNREVARRYGQEVRDAANRHFASLVPLREGKDEVYTHLMRSVYARLAVYYYCPARVADIHYMALILGHSRLLEGTEEDQRNYASSAHYNDYKVVDLDGAMRQGVRLGQPGVELLEVLKPKEAEIMAEQVQDAPEEGKRKSGNTPVTVKGATFQRIAGLKTHLGHRVYDETVTLLLDTYERGAQVPIEASGVTPERLAPDLAVLIHEGMIASGEQDFRAFLMEALSKEAKFRVSMKARHAGTDFSSLPMSKLVDIKHPEAAKERIRRAIAAIVAHNEQAQPLERWFINASVVQKLVGARFSLVAEYFHDHQAEIDSLNAKHGLTVAYNRKPIAIDEAVQVPEQ